MQDSVSTLRRIMDQTLSLEERLDKHHCIGDFGLLLHLPRLATYWLFISTYRMISYYLLSGLQTSMTPLSWSGGCPLLLISRTVHTLTARCSNYLPPKLNFGADSFGSSCNSSRPHVSGKGGGCEHLCQNSQFPYLNFETWHIIMCELIWNCILYLICPMWHPAKFHNLASSFYTHQVGTWKVVTLILLPCYTVSGEK